MKQKNKIKVLWLAPNLNHYKSRFLNHLAADLNIDLCVFFGSGSGNNVAKKSMDDFNFKQIKVDVPKKDFGKSDIVKSKIKTIFNEFDWVMIPTEKKNIMLFFYALKLRRRNKKVRLFSYNHPVLQSGNGKITLLDKWLTKFYYRNLDRVVFYTEQSCNWAVKNGLVKKSKAYWSNNTVDDTEIKKYYTYQLPPDNSNTLVYISRLSLRKRIPDLIKYYSRLKKDIPNLVLEIIGDGPESHVVESAIQSDPSIVWHGKLIDEAQIAPILNRASLVFVPGHSGLSVNHAFAYGRPYVTLQGPTHAPELGYIDKGENGFVLEGDFESNIKAINELLTNKSALEQFCNKAKQKGDYLSIQKSVLQMRNSLMDE